MATYTYSGDPESSEKDELRFYIQDTGPDAVISTADPSGWQAPDESNPSGWLISDEEIQFILSEWMPRYDSVIYCAAVTCEIIAARFASQTSVSADGVSVSMGDMQQKYNDLAQSLRDLYKDSVVDASFDMAGIYESGYDETIRPLLFGVGMHDNYNAGLQDYGSYMRKYTSWTGGQETEVSRP